MKFIISILLATALSFSASAQTVTPPAQPVDYGLLIITTATSQAVGLQSIIANAQQLQTQHTQDQQTIATLQASLATAQKASSDAQAANLALTNANASLSAQLASWKAALLKLNLQLQPPVVIPAGQ